MCYLKIRPPLFTLAISVSLIAAYLFPSEVFGRTRDRALERKRLDAMDDDARVRLAAAMREMKRRGIRPKVNSTFRSKSEQGALYRCARNRRCRARRGVYGARRPGSSMHEAGLAVDMGGVATGRRRLTPKGRQTVRIMRKHGFNWRYGLKDPAHFELNPRRAGYRTEQAAIKAGQRRWGRSVRAKHSQRRTRTSRKGQTASL